MATTSCDVLVIGGGLAGTIASLTARQHGLRVACASRSWGATALSSGAFDIAFSPALSETSQMPRSVADHVMEIIAYRHHHPYALLGLPRTLAGITGGWEILRRNCAALELGTLELERPNVWLPSSLGCGLPAAAAMASHCGADLRQMAGGGRWGILSLPDIPESSPRSLGNGWGLDIERLGGGAVEFVGVELTEALVGPGAGEIKLARWLDGDDEFGRFTELLAEQVDRLGSISGLIVPPILGIDSAPARAQQLTSALGIPVVESLGRIPGSSPGMRLQMQLDAARARADVLALGEVGSIQTEPGRARKAMLGNGIEVEFESLVLATGRFIADGIVWPGYRSDCVPQNLIGRYANGDNASHAPQTGPLEPLLGFGLTSELGEFQTGEPAAVIRATPVESHPLFTAGVMVDADLHPIAPGEVKYRNVFAAGMIVGGFASRYALCSDGVALSTGHLAGCSAAFAPLEVSL